MWLALRICFVTSVITPGLDSESLCIAVLAHFFHTLVNSYQPSCSQGTYNTGWLAN